MSGEDAPSFIADSMLGKLVRWLRILGYDAIYWRGDDMDLLGKALQERRVLLTTDRALARRARKSRVKVVALNQGTVEQMLAQTALEANVSLEFTGDKTRCTHCNAPLKSDPPERRWRCTECGKEYWIGSHWRGITRKLNRAREMLDKAT